MLIVGLQEGTKRAEYTDSPGAGKRSGPSTDGDFNPSGAEGQGHENINSREGLPAGRGYGRMAFF